MCESSYPSFLLPSVCKLLFYLTVSSLEPQQMHCSSRGCCSQCFGEKMTLEICFHMPQKQKLQKILHSLMVQDTKKPSNYLWAGFYGIYSRQLVGYN